MIAATLNTRQHLNIQPTTTSESCKPDTVSFSQCAKHRLFANFTPIYQILRSTFYIGRKSVKVRIISIACMDTTLASLTLRCTIDGPDSSYSSLLIHIL